MIRAVGDGEFCLFRLEGTTDEWTLQDIETNLYLVAVGIDQNISDSSHYLPVQGDGQATITITENGDVKVRFTNSHHTTRGGLYFMSSIHYFTCGQSPDPVHFYKVNKDAFITKTFSIGTDGFATLFSDKAYTMPENVEGGMTHVAGTNVKYYVLTTKDGDNLGFYYAAADGAAIAYQEGKAFLAIDYGNSS